MAGSPSRGVRIRSESDQILRIWIRLYFVWKYNTLMIWYFDCKHDTSFRQNCISIYEIWTFILVSRQIIRCWFPLSYISDITDHHVKIVCYCSVGYRSSNMAQKLYPEFKILKEMQKIDITSELCNLEGSIFKWANEGKELVNCNNAKTKYCHPYNFLYGKLLDAKLRVYEPVSNVP